LATYFDDSTGYLLGYSKDPFFREAANSGLILALVPGADLLVEMVSTLGLMMSEDDRREQKIEHMQGKSVRMSMSERMLFILGTVTIAGFIQFPSVFQSPNEVPIYWSFSNMSTIGLLCPCIMFLHRVQPMYFPFFVSYTIHLVICVAVFIDSVAVLPGVEKVWTVRLENGVSIMMIIAAAMFALVSVTWFVKLARTSSGQVTTELDNATTMQMGNRLQRFVVTVKVIATLGIFIIQVFWYFLQSLLGLNGLGIIIFANIAVVAVVFVLELRVRRLEFRNALFALLDAKKVQIYSPTTIATHALAPRIARAGGLSIYTPSLYS
jgi:hypothetical protein